MGAHKFCPNILKGKNRCRGSLIVEAAIFLPVFIIGILSMALIMRYIAMGEEINHHLLLEAQGASAEAHFIGPYVAKTHLAAKVNDINNRSFFADQVDTKIVTDNVIFLQAKYTPTKRLPLDFIGERVLEQQILFRCWVGTAPTIDPMPWDEMEKEEESENVFVFPRAGERYHKESCTYITNSPIELLLSSQVKNRYSPCKLCEARSTPMYNVVYCFTKTGQVYHVATCELVDKYVIEMEKGHATERGYTPCMKCY